ncbi:MAG: phosphate/phosphite/phosphonate ABC transporter substrate-binding protein [Bryobacterales bacterium]|nr:phosphate/phosphite/phosphonate ABC transporter substrate-binding protein [Bryobacterales bacterium]
MTDTTLLLGAVAYDPKVVAIWDGFQEYFAKRGLPFDYILYTNYERQVEAHFAGQIHVAWNSPLAWLQSERIAAALGRTAQAICMRDTDRDLTSVVIARDDKTVSTLADLKGRRVAVGAKDSPQATLIPLYYLSQQGVEPHRDCKVVEFDVLSGKHGDHIGGERDAVRALLRGDCDAACIIDGNHLLFVQEGTLPSGATRAIGQTPPYDHCNFTILDGAPSGLIAQFQDLLLGMSYADPQVRRLLDLEGLKRWLPGRTEGYELLSQAVDKFGYLDSFVTSVVARCS